VLVRRTLGPHDLLGKSCADVETKSMQSISVIVVSICLVSHAVQLRENRLLDHRE